MKAISIVTRSTSSSWNAAQAALYQRVVHPEGSQVPSQRVAKEETVTDVMTPKTLTTKKAISTTIAGDQRRSPSERRGTDDAAQGEHGDYDDQLHRSHDHRDRRGHRIVVLLEGGGVSGDGDDPRRPGRGAQQYRRREDRESLDEAEAEGDREPGREERQGDAQELRFR